MNIYHYRLWGTRFVVILAFFLVLLALNFYILPGDEALPVKIFCALFTLAWLAFIVDSLSASIIVDEKGISVNSWLFKKKVLWEEIDAVKLGQRWVMFTFMPPHVIIDYEKENQREPASLTLHNDIRDWRGLLAEIIARAPRRAISADVRREFGPRDTGAKDSPEVI